jgi:glucokinase
MALTREANAGKEEAGVIQVLDQTRATSKQPEVVRILAADVGGTHARIGIVVANPGDVDSIRVVENRKYVCADYPGLAAILQDFLRRTGDAAIAEGAIACAGVQMDGMVVNTNLPWRVSVEDIRRDLGLKQLALVNDFEAVAHAIPLIDPAATQLLSGPQVGVASAPTLIAGPGTGFGAAVRVTTVRGVVVLATEAGQARFAPGTELETAILRSMRHDLGYVPIEHLLSGPGLVNLYRALATLTGGDSQLAAPAAISEAALHGTDPLARQALDVFCGLMGAIVGDLVLLYRALAGVYLAGGILPQIQSFLQQSSFKTRFLDKGAMNSVLRQVPVRLLDHGQLGVVGAASWYVNGGGRGGQ